MNSQMKRCPGRGLEGVLSAGASVPEELSVPSSWHTHVSLTQKLSEAHPLGTFMEAFSWRHNGLLSPPPSFSSLWGLGDGAGSSKLLIMAWYFW